MAIRIILKVSQLGRSVGGLSMLQSAILMYAKLQYSLGEHEIHPYFYDVIVMFAR